MSRLRAELGPVTTIFRKECLELVRDLRAVFFALVLPLLLGPLAVWGMHSIATSHQEEIEHRTVRIAVAEEEGGEQSEAEQSGHGEPRGRGETSLRSRIAMASDIEIVPGVGDASAVREGRLDALVVVDPADRSSPSREVTVYWRPTSPSSSEARRRVDRLIEDWSRDILQAGFRSRGIAVDPRTFQAVEERDVASVAERNAASFSRILPFLLVILVLSGGSFAAIDLVAGEKERGTLETLAVQAVTRGQIVAGKFLVVFVVSGAAVLLNFAGMFLSWRLGWIGGGGDLPIAGLTAGRLFVIAVVMLPMTVFLSALLLGISAHARSYREAQTWLLPVTIGALVPVGLAAAPDVRLSGVLPWLPLTGPALAVREAIAGQLTPGPFLVVLVATGVWAVLALRWAARVLDSEAVLLGLEPPPLASDVDAAARERRALAFGTGMLVVVYFAAPWLQKGAGLSFTAGLLLTLWGVVALPAVLYTLVFSRRRWKEFLAWRLPRSRELFGVVAIAGAATILTSTWFDLQETILPMPRALRDEFERIHEAIQSLGPLLGFLVVAVSPGIAEELLWRGAFQGDLEPRGRPARVIAWSALFFGFFHLSIYRFVPTAFMGGVLAAVRWRTGSLLPCMVLHAAYNGAGTFAPPRFIESAVGNPWAVLLAAGILAGGLSLLGPRPRA